jgi:hypothetical protein
MRGVRENKFKGLLYHHYKLALNRRKWKLAIHVSKPWYSVSYLLLSLWSKFFLSLFSFFCLAFYCFFSFLYVFIALCFLFFSLLFCLYFFLAHVVSFLAILTCLRLKCFTVVIAKRENCIVKQQWLAFWKKKIEMTNMTYIPGQRKYN